MKRQDTGSSESRERVLNAAERLFSEHGYAAVTLRDIADALGIRQASLYHHVPGGKEALFIEVMERNFRRHHEGLQAAIQSAGDDLRARLLAIAVWLLSQPALDFGRMMSSDMPAISAAEADRLGQLAYQLLILPIASVFMNASERGELRKEMLEMIGPTYLTMIEGLHGLPDALLRSPKLPIVERMIDMLLYGVVITPRQDAGF